MSLRQLSLTMRYPPAMSQESDVGTPVIWFYNQELSDAINVARLVGSGRILREDTAAEPRVQ